MTRRDDGRIAIFFAILAPAYLAMIGLVVDGGGKIRALQRADNIAAEAARAAGQAINAGQAIEGGEKVVDLRAARGAAAAYLGRLDGVTGSVTSTGDPRSLIVNVQVAWNPVFLGAFGVSGATVTGQATANLVVVR
ncbi:membrane protein [Actinoplanes sp. OR16]|uniref:pilus assembly protein TadG-related protein n=1 Tax=Actinoplanes sp. OR16 TaxID=946334 RepID=UPI000F71C0F2|nr:pilus assembly protein TadG-related protein [Actinoplanes sp. OR16]BBH67113.1 membrane protein [Actinoplanes sp. OR16]